MAGIIIWYLIGSAVASVLIWLCKKLNRNIEKMPYSERPWGRIHFYAGNKYVYSTPQNPCEHPLLQWSTGKLGCIGADQLVGHPDYQKAIVGTITILKVAADSPVLAIIDNDKAQALGLERIGLEQFSSEACSTRANMSLQAWQ